MGWLIHTEYTDDGRPRTSDSKPASGALYGPRGVLEMRLLTDDREPVYAGVVTDTADDQLDALRWAMTEEGCTIIEVRRAGVWMQEVS